MILYIFFSLFSLVAYAAEDALHIGMELSYPPFETINFKGKPEGISVDLAHALGNYLNRKIFIENIPFVGLIPALKTGKIDLIISSMSETEEREQSIDFSDPYLTIGLALLVSKRSDLKSLKEINDSRRTLVVKSGTSAEVYAKKNLALAHLIILDKEAACVLEVVQGKADAFIYDQISIYNNWQKNLDTTNAILTPLKLEKWAIGIRKGDQHLKENVNNFLKDFREKGGFNKLENKYLSNEAKAFKALGIPFVF